MVEVGQLLDRRVGSSIHFESGDRIDTNVEIVAGQENLPTCDTEYGYLVHLIYDPSPIRTTVRR